MSLSESNTKEESENNLLNELKFIASEIKTSWQRDCDKTDSMKKLTSILSDILKKNDSLEEAFNQDEKTLQYFMTDFMKDVIYNITIQPIVYGENGDDIALEVLINIFKLFLKFHKNTKYSPLFEKIRGIINREKANSRFFSPPSINRNQSLKIDNPKRRYNYYKFNNEFYSDCMDKDKENENILSEGEKIDLLIKYDRSRNHLDKMVWIRAKIKTVNKESYCYIIESPELDSDINVEIGSTEIVPEGTMTKDWEWRKNLKKYDVIDCYDRNRWYPSTILDVEEKILENGYKKVSYHIGFRIYPKFFRNKNDENDKWENYKCFWTNNTNIDLDEKEKEEYYGDKPNIDETIDCYSKRIQKFQSYTKVQKEYLNSPTYYSSYGVNSNPKNKMEQMNYDLENDGEVKETNEKDIVIYEKNGKKNYILGKNSNFSYYYALFLKRLADDKMFEEFIEIMNNKPNSEEIFNIFFTLYNSLSYLHKKYLEENYDIFRNSTINFINNLDTKEIRNLPKDLIEMIVKFLKKVSKIITPEKKNNDKNKENEKDSLSNIDEITISLSIKMIKTSIFDKRIQGIKALNDYINENNKNEKLMKILIDLIKKNEIIKEIFGANYHSQIISKSNKILELLLKNNEIKEDDIKLIWDCTQRGDLEAKSTIMKLLSDLVENLNENFIDILFQNIINTIDINKINEKEIDFLYNLSIHAKNDNNKIKCCEYLYQCVLRLELDNNIQKSPIMENLVKFVGVGKDEKFISQILNKCENDLKTNNSSLIILQILSAILDKYTFGESKLIFINDYLEGFTKNDNLLELFKNNFRNYITRIKEQIKLNNKAENLQNYDEVIMDNYSHITNIQKRMEFLNNWIIQLYPNFDFVPFLKEILLDNPASINDPAVFYEFMKKYISEFKKDESEEQKQKKEEIKNKLFKIFTENNQSNMTMSEFKLFIAIFFGINNNAFYISDKDDNYDITLFCDDVEDLKELDKLWNVIFQIKDEIVLNKAISIIFKLYKSKDQIEKLLNKCNNLIKAEKTTNEIVDKCLKFLRKIIIESEKTNIIKTKSHSNLIKNSVAYLPLKLTKKYASYFYNSNNSNEQNDNFSEIIYGNTTINEIKELLIEKSNIPLKYIEISLSKEYLAKLKEAENKGKENKREEIHELLLDETYNNKSIIEILNNNYNIDLTLNKIFLFTYKSIEKVNLLEGKELNPKFKQILKEWFYEFTEGTGKMDSKACANYISKVTAKESVCENDDRIEEFFKTYDKENLGYVTEEKFIEFYLNCLIERKENTVWDNITSMGIREDLHKNDEPEKIEYINNDTLPRYCLGNDKIFVDTLFNLFNELENKKDIFEFLFFLSTNKEIYDYILNELNKKDEQNFEKIFVENDIILKQLYALTIIESILQDVNVNNIDFTEFFEDLKKKDNRSETHLIMKSKNYEYFDNINISQKKEFLKQFIFNHNYEKLIKYTNNLLIDYKFENNKNKIILSKCCEKCLKIINILYEACLQNDQESKKCENEDAPNNYGILYINQNTLYKIFNEHANIKENILQINFTDFSSNLIKFILILNNNLNLNNNDFDFEHNHLLRNSYSLLVTLISSNEKLFEELDSKKENKQILSSLIKSFLSCKNENYKIFYIKCLINSIKKYVNESNNKNKYLNSLFEISNSIFNEMIVEQSNNKSENNPSESSILFFDLFSLLSSIKTDNEGNEFLFNIYNIVFTYLKDIEKEKKISNEIFIGLMKILIKKIRNNINFKNIIINKIIEGKTLIEMIFEKIFKNEQKEKDSDIIIEIKTEKTKDEFINLDSIKHEKSKKPNIINKEIKDVCNDYLIECFKSSQNNKIFHQLYSIILLLNSKKKKDENGQEKKSSISTKNFDHVGLKNIGCICYMNSIMQQMYMVPTFRYAIMGSDDHETPRPSEHGRLSIDDDNLLHQLQAMYTFLTFSEKEDYNPKYFCYTFKDFDGNPTNPMIQQDSQEFYNNFCDKIENCLKKTKYKYIINDVFMGTTCSSVICESCKNVSNRFEDFYNLSMEVKNLNNLNDSLQKMIMPEKIDDFKCSNCNKNVTINKRTSLCDLPNVLVIHLKRFYMNYEYERSEKINSRFEFPLKINLKKFCIEDIISQISENKNENENIYAKEDDYYNYELKGINIHLGSADGGHYFSLINIEREGKGNILMDSENSAITNNGENKKYKWLKFNDSHISIFNINDIEKECFGGSSKGSSYNYENFQNAYMLVYERKRKTPIRIVYDKEELKEIKKDENNDNKIKINKENRKKIRKQFDLFKINSNIDENSLYNKIFNDEEKGEYYKYIPYYSIGKFAPRKIYNQVMEKNKKIEESRNKNEENEEKYRKRYYEILLNNINSDDFNILSKEYDFEIKKDLINILIEIIFNLLENKLLTEEEKANINSKTRIIIEKFILPFIDSCLKDSKHGENYTYIKIIKNCLMQKEKLEKIYINDLTAVFDNSNILLFSRIIKGIMEINFKKNENEYLTLVDDLLNLIPSIESTSTYPTVLNSQTNKSPLYYIYDLLYQFALKDAKTTKKLVRQSSISTLLGRLTSENVLERSIILDIVTHLIKSLDEYDDKLFNITENNLKCDSYFHEKTFMSRHITWQLLEILFEERIELLIILIKMMQYNELKFSLGFNTDNIFQLFEYSFQKNKIMDMIKILFGILEINDKITFNRINSILGYPTIIIKQVKNNESDKHSETKFEEKKDNGQNEDTEKQKTKNNYWPLFGERLIMEEDGKKDNNLKLKKHIFKYLSISHNNPKYCLLALLLPEEKEMKNENDITIGEKERIQLIYDLLELMLIGRGNYCLFKYIYLLPARSIYYNNLYEEILDILENENKLNNNSFNLEEIKKNADICIKRINYEVKKAINYLEHPVLFDDNKGKEEYELPKKMQKYYVSSDEVERFIGVNSNLVQSDIFREKIEIIASGSNMFLIRLEYFTKYKTPEEIRMALKGESKKEDIKKEYKKEKNILEEKKEDYNRESNGNVSDSEINSDDDGYRILKYEISEIEKEIDGKDFMFDIIKKMKRNSIEKVIIEDPSITNKNKIKSTLIRFIIVGSQNTDNDMHIKIMEKDIPDEVKENYYYPKFFVDYIKSRNISNFLNINRIRSDLPFLKQHHIGISIDVKKPKE